MKGRRGDGIGLVLVVVYETKLSSSKCWLKPTRPWATSPKTSASKPRPGQVWPDKRPPVPTCDSYSCCSQLLVALVRHNVRVPAPPSIRQTAALIMLFFFVLFLAFVKIPLSKTFRISHKWSVGFFFNPLVSWSVSSISTKSESLKYNVWGHYCGVCSEMIGFLSGDIIIRAGTVGCFNEGTCRWVGIPS